MSKFHSVVFTFLFLSGFSTGCMRKESAILPHDPGNVNTATVDMGADYRNSVYYNIEYNRMVGQSSKGSWDLALEASPEGYRFILNGAKLMFAKPLAGTKDFLSVTLSDTIGFYEAKRWDNPNGNLDSTAISNWRGSKMIYLVDRGYDETGKNGGMAKLEILAVNANSYRLRYGLLDNNKVEEITLAKDSLYNFVYLNLETGKTPQVEPPKTEWDMVFTQYTHTFYNPSYQPYLVTGCLLNRWQTDASLLEGNSTFASINRSTIDLKSFSNEMNTIGYDWKTFDGNTYEVDANKIYAIRDSKGYFYKLHFIDFLNSKGVKGNPKWEFQKL